MKGETIETYGVADALKEEEHVQAAHTADAGGKRDGEAEHDAAEAEETQEQGRVDEPEQDHPHESGRRNLDTERRRKEGRRENAPAASECELAEREHETRFRVVDVDALLREVVDDESRDGDLCTTVP